MKGSLSVSFSSVQRSSSGGEVSGGEKFDKWGSKWKQQSGCSCDVKEESVCFVWILKCIITACSHLTLYVWEEFLLYMVNIFLAILLYWRYLLIYFWSFYDKPSLPSSMSLWWLHLLPKAWFISRIIHCMFAWGTVRVFHSCCHDLYKNWTQPNQITYITVPNMAVTVDCLLFLLYHAWLFKHFLSHQWLKKAVANLHVTVNTLFIYFFV